MAVFFAVQTAHAGILSFLTDLLGINDYSGPEETINANSQTLPLLESIINIDANAAKGGGDITIVNNNAVLPDSGPLGTIADIEDARQKQQISIYIVRKGDNLEKIAQMFDVSANTIKWANNISSKDQLQEGKTLVILPITGIQYTIKKGDTLKSVTKKFNGDINEIVQYNDLTINAGLEEGQNIIIPNIDLMAEEEKTTTPAQKKNPRILNVPSFAGYYMRPIEEGRKSQGIHGYNAVDLADSCGEPIVASASGDVIIGRSSGWNGGYGKYIVISHPNGTQTVYGHMSKVIVDAGWHVVQGQLIGYVGTTGHSTGCHVHFEIRGAKNPF